MDYDVKDLNLAEQGKRKLQWAEEHMPTLMKIRERFLKEKPLKGKKIAACLHVTKETGVLVRTLRAGGAGVSLCASNPLSTQDDVAAALALEGFRVFAKKGENHEEYYAHVNAVLDCKPHLTLDDGADLIHTLHSKRKGLLKNVMGGQEETTTGVIRLRAMAKAGALKYPVFAVNDTPTKRMFDNVQGTSQSTLDGILRATNLLIAGSVFVVAGFGYCGKGLALKARGMNARVIVTEVDPVKALDAVMNGFEVLSMKEAAKVGDVFVTVTGNKDVLTEVHFPLMKNGAVLANSGHFDCEINVKQLKALSKTVRNVRANLDEYVLKSGKHVYVVGEGRLVNLAAAEGHPSEVMQMSFGVQALVSEHLAKHGSTLAPGVHEVPKEIDEAVARYTLQAYGVFVDSLSAEQKKYLSSWSEGT